MTTKVWHKSTQMIIKALFINQINQSTGKNQPNPFSSLTQISLAKLSFGFVEKASFEAVVVAAAVAVA